MRNLWRIGLVAAVVAMASQLGARTLDGKGWSWNWMPLFNDTSEFTIVSDGGVTMHNTVYGKTRELLTNCDVGGVSPSLEGLWGDVKWKLDTPKSLPRVFTAEGTLAAGFALREEASFDRNSFTFTYRFEALKDNLPAPWIGGYIGRSNVPVSCLNFLADGSSGAYKGRLMEIIEKPFAVDGWLEVWPLAGERFLRYEPGAGNVLELADAKTKDAPVYNISFYKVMAPGKTVMNKGEKLELKLKISFLSMSAVPFGKPSHVPALATVDKDWDEALPPAKLPESPFAINPVGRPAPVYSMGERPELTIATDIAEFKVEVVDAYSAAPVATDTLKGKTARFTFEPPRPSVYLVKVSGGGKSATPYEVAVAGKLSQPEATWDEMEAAMGKRLVDAIDLGDATDTHPRYSHAGKGSMVTKPFGSYWESAPMVNRGASSFLSVQFKTDKPGAPHMVEIDYPDDAERNMGFTVGEIQAPAKALVRPLAVRSGGGVVTGAPGNRMLTWRTVYFPVLKEGYVQATSNTPGWASALAKVRVYELSGGLPALKVAGKGREVMQHWERLNLMASTFNDDLTPGLFNGDRSRAEFNPNNFYRVYFRAAENLARYLRFRGDSGLQAGLYMYSAWNLFPGEDGAWNKNDAWELLGRVFAANGLNLYLSTEFIYSPRLIALHKFTDSEVAQGAPTKMPVSWEGKQDALCWAGRFVNPLTPEYQAELGRHLGKIAARYKNTPGIKGVDNVMFIPCFNPIYGDKALGKNMYLNYSYDDFTIRKFERRLGRPLPVASQGPGRFKERYDWIVANVREEWIDFLNAEFLDVNRQLGQMVKAAAPHWDYIATCTTFGDVFNAGMAGGGDIRDLLRQKGYAPGVYANDPWAKVCLTLPMSDDAKPRAQEGPNAARLNYVLEHLADPALYRWMAAGPGAVCCSGQTFYESYKKGIDDKWFFNCRDTAEYTEPSGQAAMRDFARLMAYGDPGKMLYVWVDVFPFMGNELVYQRTLAAIRALPDVAFDFAKPPVRGAAALRRGPDGYFYVVNPALNAKKLTLSVGAEQVVDLSTGKTLACPDGKLVVELPPCGILACRGGDGKAEIVAEEDALGNALVERRQELERLVATAEKLDLDATAAKELLSQSGAAAAVCELMRNSPAVGALRKQVELADKGGWAWMLLGPMPSSERSGFDNALVDETAPPDFGAKLKGLYGKNVSWRKAITAPGGIDFFDYYPDWAERSVSYCAIGLVSETAQDVVLGIGSDDGVKLWLNGKLVHQNRAVRGATRGEDKAPAHLKQGLNVLLFKIDNVVGGYQLLFDVLDQNDGSVRFVGLDKASKKQ